MDDDHALAVIRSRCDGALTAVELDQIEAAIRQRPAPIMLDADMAGKMMTVIDAIEERLGAMENAWRERAMAQEREAAFIDSASEVFH